LLLPHFGNEHILWALFGAKLVSDSNEFSLKLFRFLYMGHVSRVLEPDQVLVGCMQRGIELLNQDNRRGVVIASCEELHGNGKLWYLLHQIHAHDFVPHPSA
jgi:hypothetical protein